MNRGSRPSRLAWMTTGVCAALALPLSATAQQLTVSAAASLTDAFKEIGQRFEATKPGARVRFNFAASGVLIQQIVQGAPVDVLASADQETMDRGVQQGMIDADTRRDFAANTLVVYRDDKPRPLEIPQAPPAAPPHPLPASEQRAILDFAERSARLTPERSAEIAEIAQSLVGRRAGPEATGRLVAIANHLVGRR